MNSAASDHDIEDWLARFHDGDERAATAIYRGYFSVVSAFVRLHVDDAGAVEEIVDDTFLAAFDGLSRFEHRSSFKTWLIGIAKNKSHDWLRRAKREPSISELDDTLLLDQLVDQSWPAIERISAMQINKLLHFCLQRLTLAHREATFFVFFEEMSVEQAAQELCCSVGTVKSRLFYARLKLSDCIKRRLHNPQVQT